MNSDHHVPHCIIDTCYFGGLCCYAIFSDTPKELGLFFLLSHEMPAHDINP